MKHMAGFPISHNTYTNRGCRCDGCRDDHRRYRNLVRAKQREQGITQSKPGSEPLRNVIRSRADRPWALEAACADVEDVDIFFPTRGESATRAREICRSCPVRVECLDYAVTYHETHGVWGGLTERERRRERARAARELEWRAS